MFAVSWHIFQVVVIELAHETRRLNPITIDIDAGLGFVNLVFPALRFLWLSTIVYCLMLRYLCYCLPV